MYTRPISHGSDEDYLDQTNTFYDTEYVIRNDLDMFDSDSFSLEGGRKKKSKQQTDEDRAIQSFKVAQNVLLQKPDPYDKPKVLTDRPITIGTRQKRKSKPKPLPKPKPFNFYHDNMTSSSSIESEKELYENISNMPIKHILQNMDSILTEYTHVGLLGVLSAFNKDLLANKNTLLTGLHDETKKKLKTQIESKGIKTSHRIKKLLSIVS